VGKRGIQSSILIEIVSLFFRTSERGVKRVTETVTEEVEAEHQQADKQ
jgi:hypothetical protein